MENTSQINFNKFTNEEASDDESSKIPQNQGNSQDNLDISSNSSFLNPLRSCHDKSDTPRPGLNPKALPFVSKSALDNNLNHSKKGVTSNAACSSHVNPTCSTSSASPSPPAPCETINGDPPDLWPNQSFHIENPSTIWGPPTPNEIAFNVPESNSLFRNVWSITSQNQNQVVNQRNVATSVFNEVRPCNGAASPVLYSQSLQQGLPGNNKGNQPAMANSIRNPDTSVNDEDSAFRFECRSSFWDLNKRINDLALRVQWLENGRDRSSPIGFTHVQRSYSQDRNNHEDEFGQQNSTQSTSNQNSASLIRDLDHLTFGSVLALPNEVMLNNQITPGSRANNFNDNFRINSRPNMLSVKKNGAGSSSDLSRNGDSNYGRRPTSLSSKNPIRCPEFVENIGTKLRNQEQETPSRSTRPFSVNDINNQSSSSSSRLRSPKDHICSTCSSPIYCKLNENVRKMHRVNALLSTYMEKNHEHIDFLAKMFESLIELTNEYERNAALEAIVRIRNSNGIQNEGLINGSAVQGSSYLVNSSLARERGDAFRSCGNETSSGLGGQYSGIAQSFTGTSFHSSLPNNKIFNQNRNNSAGNDQSLFQRTVCSDDAQTFNMSGPFVWGNSSASSRTDGHLCNRELESDVEDADDIYGFRRLMEREVWSSNSFGVGNNSIEEDRTLIQVAETHRNEVTQDLEESSVTTNIEANTSVEKREGISDGSDYSLSE